MRESVHTATIALKEAPHAKGRKKKRPGCPTSANINMIAMLTHKNGLMSIRRSFCLMLYPQISITRSGIIGKSG
jgi:hypothetical protein